MACKKAAPRPDRIPGSRRDQPAGWSFKTVKIEEERHGREDWKDIAAAAGSAPGRRRNSRRGAIAGHYRYDDQARDAGADVGAGRNDWDGRGRSKAQVRRGER